MRDPNQKKLKSLALPDIDNRAVENLAAKADGNKIKLELDPDATRNFVSTTIPFNEFEHTTLMRAVEKAGYKSAKQFMRDAFLDKALHIIEGRPYGSA